MAILRNREILEMSPEEIDKKIIELKADLSKQKAGIAIQGAPENPGRVRVLRRTIARLYTVRKLITSGKINALERKKSSLIRMSVKREESSETEAKDTDKAVKQESGKPDKQVMPENKPGLESDKDDIKNKNSEEMK